MWWLAHVNQVYAERREVSNFLHPHGPSPSYVYPRQQDLLLVDAGDILTTVDPKTETTYMGLDT